MTKQDVVKPETQKLLRREKRHSGLFGRAVAFALVAFDASRHEIVRDAFAALRARQDVVERQILGVFVLAAVLTAIAVADIDPGALHCRFLAAAFDVNVGTQAHDRRYANFRRRRMQNVFAVVFLDGQFTREPHTDSARYADRAERFVRKV